MFAPVRGRWRRKGTCSGEKLIVGICVLTGEAGFGIEELLLLVVLLLGIVEFVALPDPAEVEPPEALVPPLPLSPPDPFVDPSPAAAL